MSTEASALDVAVDKVFTWLISVAYVIGAWLLGLVVFASILDFTTHAYGLLLGLIVGIIPAVFIGAFIGALWPLWALILWYLSSR